MEKTNHATNNNNNRNKNKNNNHTHNHNANGSSSRFQVVTPRAHGVIKVEVLLLGHFLLRATACDCGCIAATTTTTTTCSSSATGCCRRRALRL